MDNTESFENSNVFETIYIKEERDQCAITDTEQESNVEVNDGSFPETRLTEISPIDYINEELKKELQEHIKGYNELEYEVEDINMKTNREGESSIEQMASRTKRANRTAVDNTLRAEIEILTPCTTEEIKSSNLEINLKQRNTMNEKVFNTEIPILFEEIDTVEYSDPVGDPVYIDEEKELLDNTSLIKTTNRSRLGRMHIENKSEPTKSLPYQGKHKSGESSDYSVNKQGKFLLYPCNCGLGKKECVVQCQKLTKNKRLKLFETFWNTMSWNERKIYVQTFVKRDNIERHRGQEPRKINSIKYYLPIDTEYTRVCKRMFVGTLGLKDRTLLNLLKNNIAAKQDSNIDNDHNQNSK